MDPGPMDTKPIHMNPGARPNGRPESYGPDSRNNRMALPPPQQHYQPPNTYHPPSAPIPPPHMQEERRPYPPEYAGPAPPPHQPHPPYPPHPYNGPSHQEPMIKRSPSEDPHSALRPQSTGDIHQDHLRGHPHDEQRRQSMAGYEGIHPPSGYRPPQYHPHPLPPQPLDPVYDRPFHPEQQQLSGGPREPIPSYPSIPFTSSSSSSNHKKKAPRTSHACAQCRQAKGKCDDSNPCGPCKEKNLPCKKDPPEPKAGDQFQLKMLTMMEDLTREVRTNNSRIFKRLGMSPSSKRRRSNSGAVASDDEMDDASDASGSATSAPQHQLSLQRQPSPQAIAQSHGYSFEPMGRDYDAAPSPKIEEDAGKPIVPNPPAIPADHTTAVSKLLRWPSIRALVKDTLDADKIRDNYPQLKEDDHGVRVWGRGPNQAPSPAETLGDDILAEFASPSPSAFDNVHGQLGGGTPPAHPTYTYDNDVKGGPRSEEALIDFSPHTVKKLLASYMNHMHIMHPILNPRKLDEFISSLQNSLPREPVPPAHVPPPGFVGQHPHSEPPMKRQKRSPGNATPVENDPRKIWSVKPGALQPSIKNAVVLLVLGLGEICEWKLRVPDLIPDNDKGSSVTDSPSMRNGMHATSPIAVSSQASSLSSPQEGSASNFGRIGGNQNWNANIRRQSVESAGQHQYGPRFFTKRNMDVIPGMKYVGPATDILGNELGVHKLYHIHAHILASLYFGQMGRPFKAHVHIYNASVSLQTLLKTHPQDFSILKSHGPRYFPLPDSTMQKNQLAYAFWTTLQLEIDILAELDLLHSGITTLEDSVGMPSHEFAAATGQIPYQFVGQSYNAQIYLRGQLNLIHTFLYRPGQEKKYRLSYYNSLTQEKRQSEYRETFEMIELIPKLNQFIPNFDEIDHMNAPPATDILNARLRAKFYGTMVITYRPFLMMVMNRDSRCREESGRPSSTPVLDEKIDPTILRHAKKGIDALILSTKVFYGLPPNERFIITNPWGTAHAQFGNVLVLQAAYVDPLLRSHIDAVRLKELLIKTLDFLTLVADRDSSLNIDIKLLRAAGHKTKLLDPPQNLNTSFSSSNTDSVTFQSPALPHHPL